MKRTLRLVLVPVTLLAALGIVAFVIWREDQRPREATRVGFQDAAAPLEMPAQDAPDPRFQWLSPWLEAQVPVADRFAAIEGAAGKPVTAAADGLVIFTGIINGERTVMLAHKNAEGTPVRTIYRGLDKVNVVLHTLVPRGQTIGIAGPREASFEAHRTWNLDLNDAANRIELPLERNLPPSPLAKAMELFSTPPPSLEIHVEEQDNTR
jgi:hypothetical protein